MNIPQYINTTRDNIEFIRDYLECLEHNNEEKSKMLETPLEYAPDDIVNALQFIEDYKELTAQLRKVLEEYYK